MDKVLFEAKISGENGSYAELSLPATDYELMNSLEQLNLSPNASPSYEILRYEGYQFLAPLMDEEMDLYSLNDLARRISELDAVASISFEGLVQMEIEKKEGPLTIRKLIDLAYSTDCCNYVPAYTDEELGRFYAENDFLPELEDVSDEIYRLLDFGKIGKTVREGEGGVFTSRGYVVQTNDLCPFRSAGCDENEVEPMDDMKKDLLALAEGLPEKEWLMEHLSELSVKETIQLTAVMRRCAPHTGKEALECVLTAPAYEVWYPVGSYEALGRHYLEQDTVLPRELYAYMDLQSLGQLWEEKAPGVFIDDCYVAYPSEGSIRMGQISVYDADWSVRLRLSSPSKPDGVWLRLPDYSMLDGGAPADETALALLALGVSKLQDCQLLETRCVLPQLHDLMEQYTDIEELVWDGNDLGFLLDERGQGMPDFMERFTAALELEDCHTLKHALDIAQNLRCYDYVSADKVEDYVQRELCRAGVDLGSVPLAEACFDYQAYGEDLLDEKGYQLTAKGSGYIRRNEHDFVYEHSQGPDSTMTMRM